MKFFAFAVFFAVVLLVSSEGDEEVVKKCKTQGDCSEDECCLASPATIFKGGECRSLAKKDESCNPDMVILPSKRYLYHCPCASGFECIATQEREFPLIGRIKFDLRCLDPSSTAVPDDE